MTTAVVLAAGAGTRMRSALPKVLQPLCGRPMVLHVLQALQDAGIRRVVVVTGQGGEAVRTAVEGFSYAGEMLFVTQAEQRGTGHATLQARAAAGEGRVLVVNGDMPLLQAEQLGAVLAAGEASSTAAGAVVGTAEVPEPYNMGRIVRNAAGGVAAIVEEAEADAATAAIHEVNLGIYAFEGGWLWPTLEALPASASGELYLTDAIAVAAGEGGALPVSVPAQDGRINVEDRADLARAERVMRRRIQDRWLAAGVSIVDGDTTYIDADVVIGIDTVLEPGTHLRGATTVGERCRVGPNAIVRDSRLGDGCRLESCTLDDAVLGAGVSVGPYSTIRAGSVLDDDVHVGTHAEIKNSHLHRAVHMGHFSYLGDAEVGAESNIGAGAITCNFDGTHKQRTVIGERVFIGSDTLLIAPIEVGDDAATGAGSVVNKSVEAGALVVGSPARRMRRSRPGEEGS